MINGFKQLIVWQKAYVLSLETYKLTRMFPASEKYGMVSQLQRVVVSVPANIAEGHERNHRKEYIQFLYVAKGSLAEVETFLMLAKDLEYINEKDYEIIESLRVETAKLLNALIRSLKTDPKPPIPNP